LFVWGEFGVFNMSIGDGFDSEFKRNPLEHKSKHPKYRRIKVYIKGKKKYWKERNRRKLVFELVSKGLTYRQVSEQIGVCERTVKRDYAKIKPYYDRLIRSRYMKLEMEQKEEFDKQLAGKTPAQQLRMLSQQLAKQKWLYRSRDYNRHLVKVIINLDTITEYNPFPALEIYPNGPFSVAFPLKYLFIYVKDGHEISAGEMILNLNKQYRQTW
jgi:transposase